MFTCFHILQFKLFQLLFKKKDIVLLIINLSLYSVVNDFVLFTALKQIGKKKLLPYKVNLPPYELKSAAFFYCRIFCLIPRAASDKLLQSSVFLQVRVKRPGNEKEVTYMTCGQK